MLSPNKLEPFRWCVGQWTVEFYPQWLTIAKRYWQYGYAIRGLWQWGHVYEIETDRSRRGWALVVLRILGPYLKPEA
jgi:hypothetical protein